MNTMLNSAKEVLGRAEVSVLDSARFVRNILDAKPSTNKLTDAQFVLKVIEVGLRNIRTKEMSVADGFALYLENKQHLRPDSVRDIRCIGNRLLRTKPEFGGRNFSELTVSECEEWLNAAFTTNPQFNKARAMLHGFFGFAIRHEWCDKNPIKRIERKKVVEKEIQPLKLAETKRLIKTAQRESPVYAVVAALLVYTGIRPREVRRLTWRDIDNEEKVITIRSQCSKTGGVRQVEIPPVLSGLLTSYSSPQTTFDKTFTRIKRGKNLPDRLATALAQNQGQFGFSWAMGSGRSSPHLRKLPRQKLRRPTASATQYGTPRLVAVALPLHQYARNFPRRGKKLFQLII